MQATKKRTQNAENEVLLFRIAVQWESSSSSSETKHSECKMVQNFRESKYSNTENPKWNASNRSERANMQA